MASRPPAFAIKTPPQAFQPGGSFVAQERVMYDGKKIRPDDRLYVFSSDHNGGVGLVARGLVTDVAHVSGIVWQIGFDVDAMAHSPLGRHEMKKVTPALACAGAPEIAFKFYRQATNKTVGLSGETAQWLDRFF